MEIDLDCHVLVKDRVQFILAGLVDLGFGEDERVLGWINKRCVEMEMAEVALLEEDEEINISIGNIGYTVCKKKKIKDGYTYSFVQVVVPQHHLDIASQDDFVGDTYPNLLQFVVYVALYKTHRILVPKMYEDQEMTCSKTKMTCVLRHRLVNLGVDRHYCQY